MEEDFDALMHETEDRAEDDFHLQIDADEFFIWSGY